jgi:hypothetical protein
MDTHFLFPEEDDMHIDILCLSSETVKHAYPQLSVCPGLAFGWKENPAKS